MSGRTITAVLALFTSHAIALAGSTATFQGLGTGAHEFSSATAISADGSTVVGNTFDETGSQAFRWTRAEGIQSLGDLINNFGDQSRSYATAASGDGAFIVGRAEQPDNVRAFRWYGPVGMLEASSLSTNTPRELNAISLDGSIAAGRFNAGGAEASTQLPLAARWFNDISWQSLDGALPDSNAFGISGDGSVVVGVNENHAFRWTEAGGIVDIGPTGVTPKHSIARDVSDDGTVVVGDGGDGEDAHAFRWTTTGGLQFIAPNEPLDTFAYATDANGSVIVGQVGFQRAYVWDEQHGLRDLQNLLATQGADLTGWTLERAFGISGDGRTIVGDGKHGGNTEAWIATLADEPTSAIPLPAPVAAGCLLLTAAGVVAAGHRVKWCGDGPTSARNFAVATVPTVP
jgi:probable HAF family extracellular repeat protein